MIVSNDELYEFFARLGESLYFVQVIEGTLHKILVIKSVARGEKISQKRADEALESFRKLPLGNLIKRLEGEDFFPDELLKILRKFNAERRWLVHRMRDDTELTFRRDPDLRLKITSRVSEIAHVGAELNEKLTAWLVHDQASNIEGNPVFEAHLLNELKKGGFA